MSGKFYKKPHNWRWQRYYGLKNAKASLEEELEQYHLDNSGHVHDMYWDNLRNPLATLIGYIPGFHCCENCYYDEIGMGSPKDICEYNYQKLFENITNFERTVQNLNIGDDISFLRGSNLQKLQSSSVPGNHIEERLYKHFMDLDNLEQNRDMTVKSLRAAIGNVSNIEIIEQAVDPKHSAFIAKWTCLLSPFWLRSPQSWKPESGKHILDHLFIFYDVPSFLLEQWFPNTHEGFGRRYLPFKWIVWYLIIGQGGSLQKASKRFAWNIYNKFQHFLLEAPNTNYPMESCLYAEIFRLGGNRQDFMRIMYSRSLVIDPTEQTYDESYLKFWQHTVFWLIKNREAISDEESSLIVDWALHRYTETTRIRNEKEFTWKGRKVRNVLVASEEYAATRFKPSWVGYHWEGHNWDWIFTDGKGDAWDFTELINGKQLYEEGQYMRHCVGTYVGRCASGTSAIFSLKKNGNRVITIEISPKLRMLVQCLGKGNRRPSEEESNVIKRWLSLACGKVFT
ncbi:PcfJ domain-containing protein [Arenibacter sp. GZD96]|uniref:PcfJ domain-containing protein n=1 Tax=Aurantibrevibacter litoralis TaxID=3106030 RepID=UPI002AFFE457|nr:PcfJ domain-containing protein [Arenibacter sp. GZD-96]MEA1787266.1 PcfJ domain-containing protein [Arenibacter sp. GZD-96]